MLKWQLASLFLNPPKLSKVHHTTCVAFTDEITFGIWKLFRDLGEINNVKLELVPMKKSDLFRRAIGRNLVAKTSECDVVWFADCDYFYGDNCIDSLSEQVTEDDTLYYPGSQFISFSHTTGDRLIEYGRGLTLPEPTNALREEFIPKSMGKAIGGLQIVTGNTSRSRGYLDNTKWMKPVDPSLGFQDTKCDIAYRKSINNEKKIEIPNLFRIRHSITGLEIANKLRGQD